MKRPMAIAGVGQTPYRRAHSDASTGDLVFRAVSEALADAGLDRSDVGAVVAGVAPDALAGVNCIEKSVLGAVAPPGAPFFRVNTGGATGSSAALAAMTLVASGRSDVVVAFALERMGQAITSQQVFNTIFDPIYEKDFVLTTITMAALRASLLMARYGYTERHWAALAARNHRNALKNPLAHLHRDLSVEAVLESPLLAWPIHLYEACPMSEGACALVIAGGDRLPAGRPVAWIHGAASYSDSYAMGDRFDRPEGTLVDLVTLRRAAEVAYRQAGIVDPGKEIDVVEIHAPFSSAEVMAYPPLGLCAPEDGPAYVDGLVDTDGAAGRGAGPFVNPSGGPMAANPVSATAMIRIAECALQVRGAAGDRQVDGARRAVATGQGGATQFSSACVLSAEPPGGP
jgi:acetyl-CoA C-acetyltransferase